MRPDRRRRSASPGWVRRAVRAAGAALALLGAARAAIGQGVPLVDALDLTSAPSRTAHGVRIRDGSFRAERARLGTLDLPVGGARLEVGGSVTARLRAGIPESRLLVTLATTPNDWGRRQAYAVQVDGRELCRVEEAEPGAGTTRSFWLPLTPARERIEVTVVCGESSEVPVTVAALRVYPAAATGPPRMGLALLSPDGLGYSIDGARMKSMAALIPQSPHTAPQTAVLYNYSSRGPAQNRDAIRRLAAVAVSTGIPLRIAFQMHWAGLPAGVPDGAGGTFTDLPYQQITWDPDDQVDDPGLKALMGDRYDVRFGLSVPNRWGNTPWLTFNHPRLNQLRRVRLRQALAAWGAERDRLRAAGRESLLPGEISTGEETIYWARGVDDSAYQAINGGKARAHLAADFNPYVAADAMRDGVDLDPRDGLDARERWWLHQNLARQQQRIVDWMLEAVPASPVQLGAPAPFASDLVRRNLYTEPYAMPCFPMQELNPRHPGLEVGYVRDGRSGGEYWSGATMLPWLTRERERGRIALPNLECTGADDGQLVACLRAAYACGARFVTLYNWQHRQNTSELLERFVGSIDEPAAVEFAPSGAGAQASARVYSPPGDAFGINRVWLYPVPETAGPGSRVRVRLRDMAPGGGDVSVIVDVGTVAGGTEPLTVALPGLLPVRPGGPVSLTVEPVGGPPARFRAAADGQLAVRLASDIQLERERSVRIEEWQDAADLLESLRGSAGVAGSRFALDELTRAGVEMAAGRPVAAYRAGIRAEQLALPAAFDVPAPGGRLAPYFVTVQCAGGPVRATLTAYGERQAAVTVVSRAAQRVRVGWGAVQSEAVLSPGVPAQITLDAAAAPRVASPVRPRRRGRARAARRTRPRHGRLHVRRVPAAAPRAGSASPAR